MRAVISSQRTAAEQLVAAARSYVWVGSTLSLCDVRQALPLVEGNPGEWGQGDPHSQRYHIVAYDFGIKRNIYGCS